MPDPLERPRLWAPLLLALLLAGLVCDQVSKLLAAQWLAEAGLVRAGGFDWVLVYNQGSGLSDGSAMGPAARILHLGVTPLAALWLMALVVRPQGRRVLGGPACLVLAACLGAGAGNLVDRLHPAGVVDFLVLAQADGQLYVANLADLALVAALTLVPCLAGWHARVGGQCGRARASGCSA